MNAHGNSGMIALRHLLVVAALALFLFVLLLSLRDVDSGGHSHISNSRAPADRTPSECPQAMDPAVGPAAAERPAPVSSPTRDRNHRPGSPFPEAPVVAAPGTPSGAAGTEVLALPWGHHPSAVGLYVPQDEGLPVGPASFAIGPDGKIYVADRVNRRITILFPSGQVDRIIDVEGNLADLAVDGAGRLHTLEYGTGIVRTLDARTGQEIASTTVERLGVTGAPVEGLIVRDGEAFLRNVDQQVRPIAEAAGGWQPDRVVTGWPQGGAARAEFSAPGGGTPRSFPVEADTDFVQGSVQYLGRDGTGGSFLLVETLSASGEIDSSVRRYDAEGRFAEALPVPYLNLAQPDRTFTVDAHGRLYQMTTDEAGMRVFRYDWKH